VHWQRSAATVAVLPSGAGPEATLVVVCQLLHNPPSAHASPSEAEQWCHDVDQLIGAAINTMPQGGRQENHLGGASMPSMAHSRSPAAPSCSPVVPRASLAVRASSHATVDLQVELECCRLGEDGRITIEHQRERHRCQGCNLNGDFGAVDTTPMR
jgi:hypothetical protein